MAKVHRICAVSSATAGGSLCCETRQLPCSTWKKRDKMKFRKICVSVALAVVAAISLPMHVASGGALALPGDLPNAAVFQRNSLSRVANVAAITPQVTGINLLWGYTSTPTTSRYNVFKLMFSQPVRGLTSASFANIGSRAGCTFTPVARERSGLYSSRYDVFAFCPGVGTVAPRLTAVSLETSGGFLSVNDTSGANVVHIMLDPVLTVMKTGGGSGVVASTISGIDCGVMCVGVYPARGSVTLRATASLGSVFTGWSGACTGTALCTVGMTASRTVTANFIPVGLLLITKVGNGVGAIASTPTGSACPATAVQPCLSSHRYGTVITLRATASLGSRFIGWAGDCSGTTTCVVTISDAMLVYPIFERI